MVELARKSLESSVMEIDVSESSLKTAESSWVKTKVAESALVMAGSSVVESILLEFSMESAESSVVDRRVVDILLGILDSSNVENEVVDMSLKIVEFSEVVSTAVGISLKMVTSPVVEDGTVVEGTLGVDFSLETVGSSPGTPVMVGFFVIKDEVAELSRCVVVLPGENEDVAKSSVGMVVSRVMKVETVVDSAVEITES